MEGFDLCKGYTVGRRDSGVKKSVHWTRGENPWTL